METLIMKTSIVSLSVNFKVLKRNRDIKEQEEMRMTQLSVRFQMERLHDTEDPSVERYLFIAR